MIQTCFFILFQLNLQGPSKTTVFHMVHHVFSSHIDNICFSKIVQTKTNPLKNVALFHQTETEWIFTCLNT